MSAGKFIREHRSRFMVLNHLKASPSQWLTAPFTESQLISSELSASIRAYAIT
jgi:hypothetical protein